MAKCFATGKKTVFGNTVSHSHRRGNRQWKVNMKKVRINDNGVIKRVYVSTSDLKSGLVKRA